MSINLQNQATEQACNLAKLLADSLVEKGRIDRQQHRLAYALADATRTIVALEDVDDVSGGDSCARKLEDLANTTVGALAEAMHLSEKCYNLSDVKAQLGVAMCIVDVLDCIVGSSILSGIVLEWLSDKMHDQLTPLLRLAVRVGDPDKFEADYVPDAWVQSSAAAMRIAAQLSRAITTADTKASEERPRSDLAA